jgi:cytochrome c
MVGGEALQEQPAAAALMAEVEQQLEQDEIRTARADTASFIKEDSLKNINALVLYSLDPEQLNNRQQTELERYVQAGGSLVVLQLSADTLRQKYAWPWYVGLVKQLNGTGASIAQKKEEKAVQASMAGAVKSIFYNGGQVTHIPIDFSKAVAAPDVQKLVQAIKETADRKKPDFSNAKALAVPDEKRFVRVVLESELNEPMQMAILPDQRVLMIEREGLVKLYKPEQQATKVLANFSVSTEGNYEDGMLGIAADPNFANNGWVYIYYSPAGSEPKQNLSRFKMEGDSLLLQSEKIVLEVAVQRETCCHSGGGVEFGPDGNLYLSTGDNTSSKESNGFTPIDERPGRAPFDAQKSSANTHDLRGKILRIKPQPDGSYTIPDGNLFAKDGSEGRPEIYVMGTRNPFRFTVDQATGYVYWGDVGPDGGEDGVQGPQSYDEWNQARKAGNWGWPYFVGDNKAYPDWDFTTDKPGPLFDPQKPVNESPNNTGSKVLPPAQKALIWYPYGESEIFPMLGAGSRSAMGGPFYYARNHGQSEKKFPDYYNGKWFIYEWARSWIKVVSFDENHKLLKIEPFLPAEEFVKPIDMRFGPDGALYLLEYGANYFADNDEARLVRIEYTEGNRAPIARISANKTVGAAPLQVQFSAAESFDYDEQETLTYEWYFTDQRTVASTEKTPTYTFQKPGVYTPTVKITDSNGKTNTASLQLSVGNEPPVVTVNVEGNRSFFYDGRRIRYKVGVRDKEDGSLSNGGIDKESVLINYNYLAQSKDLALLGPEEGLSSDAAYLIGKQLVESSDCRSCHTMATASVGPSYQDIAQRYKGDYSAVEFLAKKIVKGGGGNWGDRLMAAHPQHTEEETVEMTKYILSVADEKPARPKLPLEGTLAFEQHQGKGEEGTYIFSVAYRDKGANGVGAITSRENLLMRHPRVQAEHYDAYKNVQQQRPQGGSLAYVSNIQDGSYIMFKAIDLTNISKLNYQLSPGAGGSIALRLNAPDGPVVSMVDVEAKKRSRDFSTITAPVKATQGIHDLYFVFKNRAVKGKDLIDLDWIYFQ